MRDMERRENRFETHDHETARWRGMGGVVRYAVAGIGDYGGPGLDRSGHEGEAVSSHGSRHDSEHHGCGMHCSHHQNVHRDHEEHQARQASGYASFQRLRGSEHSSRMVLPGSGFASRTDRQNSVHASRYEHRRPEHRMQDIGYRQVKTGPDLNY